MIRPSNNVENKSPLDILKSLADMYDRLGSQFLRTTTGIHSGPDVFDKLRFVMTFLIILWITEILCSFRLVLEGKTGKEIPESLRLEFFEKFSVNNFALPDAEDNISCLLNRGGIADFTFVENDISNLQVTRVKFLGSFVLLSCASLAASRMFCNDC